MEDMHTMKALIMFPDDIGTMRHEIVSALIEVHNSAISFFPSFTQSDLETSLHTDQ
jgi:hypothetical protein